MNISRTERKFEKSCRGPNSIHTRPNQTSSFGYKGGSIDFTPASSYILIQPVAAKGHEAEKLNSKHPKKNKNTHLL